MRTRKFLRLRALQGGVLRVEDEDFVVFVGGLLAQALQELVGISGGPGDDADLRLADDVAPDAEGVWHEAGVLAGPGDALTLQ